MRKELMIIAMSVCACGGLVGFLNLEAVLVSGKILMQYLTQLQSVNITLRIMGQARLQTVLLEMELVKIYLFGKMVKGCA